MHKSGLSAPHSPTLSDLSLFGSPGQPTHARKPSFIVSIVLEALRNTPAFTHVVHVVPDEADSYCADRVKSKGGVVLTSDSDLLIYDIGHGRVAFFDEIQENMDESAENKTDWLFRLYDIRTTLKEHRLSKDGKSIDPLRIGFEVWSRPRPVGWHEIMFNSTRELQTDTQKEKFAEFCQHYQTPKQPLPVTRLGNTVSIRGLDPRMSEAVLQLSALARIEPSGGHDENERDSMDAGVYMHHIWEDYKMATPWAPSTCVRQLAYTIISWIFPEPRVRVGVQEFRRIQRIWQYGSPVQILSQPDAEDVASVILDFIEKLKAILGPDRTHLWTLLCLALDVKDCIDTGKRSHVLHMVGPGSAFVNDPIKNGRIHWNVIHFVGHLEAGYYSLRVLQKMISIIPTEDIRRLPRVVEQLRYELIGFPGYDEFPDMRTSLKFLEEDEAIQPFKILDRLIDMPDWVLPVNLRAEVPKKDKKRKKKQASESEEPESSGQKSARFVLANPFTVLDYD